MTTTSVKLLKLALPLIKTHGFTREALSLSVLSLPTPLARPLPDASVTALFGPGDDACRTLVHAWLDDARRRMKEEAVEKMGMGDVLKARLKSNEPVLEHLPEAFALLASSSSLLLPLLSVDPAPIIKHAVQVSNQACWIAHSDARELSWYTRRASISAIYLAAELHQLTSPKTAPEFLDSLLENTEHAGKALDETALFASYIWKSWRGIVRSSGVLV
ncbi:uncharacterized protein BJ212DRAFT_1445389 [Suillus subaureus]|uniref:COQ9 C-terminal domain-containing protein n=1 Tax=Suillus subaureus TaxID=48587 RepID=A0A9P7EJ35_9AGAM|nr:uncharacterized protein BJ212DRAFT_1445389 [Suillus subaureus]KAG1822050.1 hypothetical protein BJ212DRAFT_1445389 [Suillus subaureus]